MAKHVRQQVREAAVTDLTGLTTTGANVFTSRVSPLKEAEMPGMYIMLRDEGSEFDAMGKIARTGQLVVEAWASGEDGLEDLLDDIAAEVEAKLYGATATLTPLLINIGAPRTQVEIPQPDSGVSLRIGIIRMLFPVVYRTAIGAPTATA